MGKAKIKLDKDLMEKVKKYAKISGYSSPEEFITHCRLVWSYAGDD
ncbi:hypothetical protein ES703_40301 [subsurface metagenome]